jgi:lipoyl(octanoyl) transferase
MTNDRRLLSTYLGLVPYAETWALQVQLREAVQAGRSPGGLLLLQHPPTISLGRHALDSNVLVSPERLAERGVGLARIERGGDVTVHAPGQLVGYPVMPVRGGVRRFVQALAAAAADVLAAIGIAAEWRDDRPGLWTDQGKIAAVGLHVDRGVAIHGMAINVTNALDWFALVVPCGLREARVTSVLQHLGQAPAVSELAPRYAEALARRLGLPGCAFLVPPERFFTAAAVPELQAGLSGGMAPRT